MESFYLFSTPVEAIILSSGSDWIVAGDVNIAANWFHSPRVPPGQLPGHYQSGDLRHNYYIASWSVQKVSLLLKENLIAFLCFNQSSVIGPIRISQFHISSNLAYGAFYRIPSHAYFVSALLVLTKWQADKSDECDGGTMAARVGLARFGLLFEFYCLTASERARAGGGNVKRASDLSPASLHVSESARNEQTCHPRLPWAPLKGSLKAVRSSFQICEVSAGGRKEGR